MTWKKLLNRTITVSIPAPPVKGLNHMPLQMNLSRLSVVDELMKVEEKLVLVRLNLYKKNTSHHIEPNYRVQWAIFMSQEAKRHTYTYCILYLLLIFFLSFLCCWICWQLRKLMVTSYEIWQSYRTGSEKSQDQIWSQPLKPSSATYSSHLQLHFTRCNYY